MTTVWTKTRLVRPIVAGVVILALAPTPVAGQALPRAPDGKPDLSGIWQAVNTAAWNILPHPAQPGVPAGLGVVEGDEIPYNAAGAAKQRENFANRATAVYNSAYDILRVVCSSFLKINAVRSSL